MRLTNININSKMNGESYLNDKTSGIPSKRAGVIAWVIFFGIGVSYFVATLIVAVS